MLPIVGTRARKSLTVIFGLFFCLRGFHAVEILCDNLPDVFANTQSFAGCFREQLIFSRLLDLYFKFRDFVRSVCPSFHPESVPCLARFVNPLLMASEFPHHSESTFPHGVESKFPHY
jgi:hypothetical protein